VKVRQYPLYLMLLPSLVFLAVFIYTPMYGLLLTFKTFTISGGVFGSPWIKPWYGNFWWMKDPEFWNVFRNTLKIAGLKFVTGFPAPIILALLINEVQNGRFKRTTQTILYLPHFVSWVIFAGIVYRILGGDSDSPVNLLLGLFRAGPVDILPVEKNFIPLLVITGLIKEVGWGTILYLAAISTADPQLYDAASIDGCGQWKKAIHITVPTIVPIVVIMAILSLPGILSAGFDQIYNMQNSMVARASNVLDIYIIRIGIVGGQYSYAIAMGLFLQFISLGLVLAANKLSKRGFGYGIW